MQAAAAATETPSSGAKRLVKSKSGLKIVCQHDRECAPWDMAEPHWVPDKDADYCIACKTKFDFIKRRHHCRRCGQIYCGKCSSHKVQFHRMGFVDPVRLCKPCSDITKKEEEFFRNDLKLLWAGVPLKVSKATNDVPGGTGFPSVWDPGMLYNVRLSLDQRFLLFDPHESSAPTSPATSDPPSSIGAAASETDDAKSARNLSTAAGNGNSLQLQPIDLNKIIEIETHDSEKIGPGGLSLQVKVGPEEETFVRLEAPPEPSRKPSIQWNGGLVRGIRMVLESRYQAQLDDDNILP